MITLDQQSKDQNNAVDWRTTSDSALLSVDPAALTYDAAKSARPVDPVTPADLGEPVPSPGNPSPDTPGDLLSAPNDDNDSTSSLSPAPSPARDPPPVDPRSDALQDPAAATAAAAVVAAASRQSTPLTDLSAPMTPSRAKDDDAARAEAETDPPKKEGQDVESKVDEHPKTEPASSSSPQLNGVTSPTSAELPTSQAPPTIHKTPPEPPDEKASTILQLNSELLKCVSLILSPPHVVSCVFQSVHGVSDSTHDAIYRVHRVRALSSPSFIRSYVL